MGSVISFTQQMVIHKTNGNYASLLCYCFSFQTCRFKSQKHFFDHLGFSVVTHVHVYADM